MLKMFSKLRRSKSDTHTRESPAPLCGMPALKQMRALQRQEKLSFRKSLDDDQPITNGSPEKSRLETFDHATEDKMSSDVADIRRHRSDVSESTRKTLPNGKVVVESNLDNNAASKSQKQSKGTSNEKKTKNAKQLATTDSTKKKDEHRGRRLHSIKKRRKARRESGSGVMQALTPRERESITFLDDVIKLHDQLSLNESREMSEEDLPDFESDSDSSVGSVIDLVGNLSDCHVSPTSSHSPYNFSQTSHNVSDTDEIFRNEFLNRCNWQRTNQPRIYEEVTLQEEKVMPQNSAYDVYAEIPDRSSPKDSTPSNEYIEENIPIAKEYSEPVYSVVKKPKNTAQVQLTSPKLTETNRTNTVEQNDAMTETAIKVTYQRDNHDSSSINKPSYRSTNDNPLASVAASSKRKSPPPLAPKPRSTKLKSKQNNVNSDKRQTYGGTGTQSFSTIDLNKNNLSGSDQNKPVAQKPVTTQQRDIILSNKPFTIVPASRSDISWM